jgi:hypothetical protein
VAHEKETFLGRWSRRKQEERSEEKKLPEKPEADAPELPPADKLTPESDFTGFMHPKVEDAVRRVALRKLFSDPHFNVPDPYEPFSGDWTVAEPISEEMLKTLNQARTHLFDDEKKEEKEPQRPPQEEINQSAEAPKEDEPRREDT